MDQNKEELTDEQFAWIVIQIKAIQDAQSKMIQIHLDRAKKEAANGL